MSEKYKFGEKSGAYFISFATVNWIDVFTRVNQKYVLIALQHCQQNKGL